MNSGNVISTDELAALSASAGRYLRKVLQSVIGSSEAMIPATGFPGPDEVHDIRVNMKKCRAILKLLRASPDSGFYCRENSSLRYISSLFSTSRENEVLKKTLRMLSKNYPEIFTDNFSDTICGMSYADHNMKFGDTIAFAVTSEARELLRRSWYRIGFISLNTVTRDVLLDGLYDSFLRAERAFILARSTSIAADLHEFRKRSKDLLYQVRFFSDYNPGHFEEVHSNLDEICSILGKCNDLSVALSIFQTYRLRAGEKKTDKAMKTIMEERSLLAEKVFPMADKFFTTFYSGA